MKTSKWLWANSFAAVASAALSVPGVQPAHAEPLVPPTPAEVKYLEQLRQVFSTVHDPVAFNSDGELLDDGRYVCNARDQGFGGSPNMTPPMVVGQGATLLSPIITQVAFATLCPK